MLKLISEKYRKFKCMHFTEFEKMKITQFVFKIHPPNVQFSEYSLAHFISKIFIKTILILARIEKFCSSCLSLPISYVSFKSQTIFFFLRKDFTDLPININSLL